MIVAGLRSRTGASNSILRLVAGEMIRLLATPGLFLEYEEVLKRPEQRAVHKLDTAHIDGFLSALAGAIEPVDVHIAWRPQLRDAADEMVLEAAINGRSDALVTFDVRDFAPAISRFRLRVVRPAEILKEVNG